MDKRFLVLATLAAAVAVPAAAGPYDQPYSIIATEYKAAVDPLERKLIMNRVDDQNSRNNEFVVPPGPHKVTVDLPPRKGFRATQVTFDLETKACTRYFVVAKLKTQVTQDWEPVVKYEEPIGECKAKFKT
jgi:hypothetical protein